MLHMTIRLAEILICNEPHVYVSTKFFYFSSLFALVCYNYFLRVTLNFPTRLAEQLEALQHPSLG